MCPDGMSQGDTVIQVACARALTPFSHSLLEESRDQPKGDVKSVKSSCKALIFYFSRAKYMLLSFSLMRKCRVQGINVK